MKKTFKIIKKLNILILFIMSLFCVTFIFSACAQVRVMTITNTDNTIDEFVTVTLDQKAVNESGYDFEDVKLDIKTTSTTAAESMVEKLNKKINVDMLLANNDTKKILTEFYDGVSVVSSEWNSNVFAIGIRFKNIDVYKYYYNIQENTKTEMKTEEHFFYDKVYYYGNTMYVKHHDLYDSVNDYYSSKYPTLINSDTNELLYTYKTELRRQHSDADYITKQDGEYYHTWVVNKDSISEPIMLYYNVANPESYIIIAIGVAVLSTATLLGIGALISFVKSKKEKNDEN